MAGRVGPSAVSHVLNESVIAACWLSRALFFDADEDYQTMMLQYTHATMIISNHICISSRRNTKKH